MALADSFTEASTLPQTDNDDESGEQKEHQESEELLPPGYWEDIRNRRAFLLQLAHDMGFICMMPLVGLIPHSDSWARRYALYPPRGRLTLLSRERRFLNCTMAL